MTWRGLGPARYSVALLATVAALVGGVLPAGVPSAAAAEQVVFTDGFENGNSWTFYTNGSDGTFGLTSNPVHSGASALAMSASADPNQPEIGIAAIRDGLSITEDSSVLSFWYYATGSASYRNMSVELHTAVQSYYLLLPDPVVTSQWHEVSVPFTDVSTALAGATVSEIVIKAITDPTAGTGSVALDDISVTDGVVPVAQPPAAISTMPAPGAANVGRDRLPTVTFDRPLDPASVSTGTVVLRRADGRGVAGDVRYLAGQHAVVFVPSKPLAASQRYSLTVSGVRGSDGATQQDTATMDFRTGRAAIEPETSFLDDFAGSNTWRLYSTARGGASQAIVSHPALAPGGSLLATGRDDSAPFVISQIHDLDLVDENSTISFDYRVSGTAVPAELDVMLTTRDGRAKQVTMDAGRVVTNRWASAAVTVSDVSRTLIGQAMGALEIKIATSTPGSVSFAIDRVRITSNPGAFQRTPPADTEAVQRGRSGGGSAIPARLSRQTVARIRSLADHILASQNPDGSIPVGLQGATADEYTPYFSTYAALGLVRAGQVTRDRRYVAAAQKYANWYRSHLQQDGSIHDYTGQWPNLADTGTADSVDSYASTYLLLLLGLTQEQGSTRAQQRYLREWYPTATSVYGALDGVYLANGMTEAKPSYPVEYLQDNSESWLGLQAMAGLASIARDRTDAQIALTLAARTQYAARETFLRDGTLDYGTSVSPPSYDVQPAGPLQTWYPDALSDVLMLGILGGGPGEPAGGDAALLRRLVQQFDVQQAAQRPTDIVDTQMYLWWAMAGLATRQPAIAAHFVNEYTDIEGAANPATLPFTAAHLIRVLCFGYDGALWL